MFFGQLFVIFMFFYYFFNFIIGGHFDSSYFTEKNLTSLNSFIKVEGEKLICDKSFSFSNTVCKDNVIKTELNTRESKLIISELKKMEYNVEAECKNFVALSFLKDSNNSFINFIEEQNDIYRNNVLARSTYSLTERSYEVMRFDLITKLKDLKDLKEDSVCNRLLQSSL